MLDEIEQAATAGAAARARQIWDALHVADDQAARALIGIAKSLQRPRLRVELLAAARRSWTTQIPAYGSTTPNGGPDLVDLDSQRRRLTIRETRCVRGSDNETHWDNQSAGRPALAIVSIVLHATPDGATLHVQLRGLYPLSSYVIPWLAAHPDAAPVDLFMALRRDTELSERLAEALADAEPAGRA